ncbi:MAG TPA: segregation and condensation protein A [Sulfuricella sp.]|nr:segregation and condensation protein A [Sulfuricella sp.]
MTGNNETSMEQRILRVMRKVLGSVVKDTTPQPGMQHALSDQTIEDIKACFALIATREMELAKEAGIAHERPHFSDEPQKAKVVPINRSGLRNNKPKE